MRGEHFKQVDLLADDLGSSPHARGTPFWLLVDVACAGIIPACAGNTRWRQSGVARGGDHPRMRGEHIMHGVPRSISAGSSPHARGTPTRFGVKGNT